MLILSGIVVSALFSALVALIKFAADPESVLPSITFWLMGSLASATWSGILMALPFVTLGTVLLYLYRWKLAALSLPEDEARSLGISVRRLRFTAILASALITSSIVALCGLVGWVGLLIPHAARMLFGGSVRRLIPGSVCLARCFLLRSTPEPGWCLTLKSRSLSSRPSSGRLPLFTCSERRAA